MAEEKTLEQKAAEALARRKAEAAGEAAPDPSHVNPALDGPGHTSGAAPGDLGIGFQNATPQPDAVPFDPTSLAPNHTTFDPAQPPLSAPPTGKPDVEYENIPAPMSPEEVARRLAEQPGQSAPAASMAQIAAQKMGSMHPAAHEDVIADRVPPTSLAADEETIVGGDSIPAPQYDEETIILGEDAIKQVDGIPKDARTKFFATLMPETQAYEKELVTKYGYTPAEAAIASRANAGKKASEFAAKWREEHPEGVIVTMDKTGADQVEFTDEERAKMQEAKALKLIVVESAELEQLVVADPHKIVPMSRLRSISSLSNYSVPLLTLGDYASFRGAQSMKLAMSIAEEDASLIEIIEKKASLLYEHFIGSTLIKPYDEDGNPISYDEFCNIYKYDDMDMGVYAIVTASAMEVTESRYVCQQPNCRAAYNLKYNQKALLDLSGIPESFKDRIGEIDKFRDNDIGMQQVHDKYDKRLRIRSCFSQNVYELNNPTIAQARMIAAACEASVTEGTYYDMALTSYLARMWIWDAENQNYIPIDVLENPELAFQTVCRLHQIDFRLLSDFIGERRYHPEFKIKAKCPVCGYDGTDTLTVDGMVFLHARAIFPEIKS